MRPATLVQPGKPTHQQGGCIDWFLVTPAINQGFKTEVWNDISVTDHSPVQISLPDAGAQPQGKVFRQHKKVDCLVDQPTRPKDLPWDTYGDAATQWENLTKAAEEWLNENAKDKEHITKGRGLKPLAVERTISAPESSGDCFPKALRIVTAKLAKAQRLLDSTRQS